MVRRRQRIKKSVGDQLVEDKTFAEQTVLDEQQCCISPKRKDNKNEICNNQLSTNGAINSKANIKSKDRNERGMGRVTGAALATRSQSRTIENYFKSNYSAKSVNLEVVKKNDILHELCEDGTSNDTDNTEFSDDFNTCYEFHRTLDKLNDNNNCNKIPQICENIFLQKPVLKLNVDESLIQVKHLNDSGFKNDTVFSTPSSFNGGLNKLMDLKKIISVDCTNTVSSKSIVVLPDNDNSSCDSGIAFSTPLLEKNYLTADSPISSIHRKRKPTTPHRIVCSSSIKSMPVLVSPLTNNTVTLISRKSQRHIDNNNTSSVILTGTSKTTRRRLNHQQESHYQNQQTSFTTKTNKNLKQNDYSLNRDMSIFKNTHNWEQVLKHDMPIFTDFDVNIDNTATELPSSNNLCSSKKHTNNQPNLSQHNKLQTTSVKIDKIQHKPSKNISQNKIKGGNRELSEFFPVRRSVRKTKSAVKEEMMQQLEQAILEERAEGLYVKEFDGKGRGVVAARCFQRGEFVVEYVGDLITMTEAANREKNYALDENAGCYMYYFKHKNQQYCIDATEDTGKLGRLVNHSRNGNLVTKVVVVKQRPHLILIAKDNIAEGEELCYDYGDRSKESLLHHPWLAF